MVMERDALVTKVTDELVYLREVARENKDYLTSDIIREILDERGSFVFDTPDGQVVYHLGKGYTTREEIKNDLDLLNAKFER